MKKVVLLARFFGFSLDFYAQKKRQHDNEITDSLLSLTPLTVEKISSGRICAEGKIIPLFF